MKTISLKAISTVALVVVAGVFFLLSGCSPQEGGASVPAGDAVENVEVNWSLSSECATCHAKEGASADGGAALNAEHVSKNVTCITCHSSEEELAVVHEGKTATDAMPKRLKKTEMNDEVCLQCHNHEALVEATISYDGIVDSEGFVANPHQLPDNEDHEDAKCWDCHSMHADTDVQEETLGYCFGCHQEVFECHTCHS